MRGTKAKAIRRHVAKTYPYLPDESLYQVSEVGVRTLTSMCRRALSQHMKRQYVRLYRRTDK